MRGRGFVVLSAVVLLIGYSRLISAQTAPGVFVDANHPSGPPDPQRLGDIWNIDPINNQVSIAIPFSTTPQGGRGPKLPFTLLYNSAATVTLQAAGTVVVGSGASVLVSTFKWSATPIAYIGSITGPTGPWTTSGPFFYSSFSNIPDMGFTDTNGAYHVTGAGCTIGSPYTFVDQNGISHDENLLDFSSSSGYASPGFPWTPPCGPAQSASTTNWPSAATTDGSAILTGANTATGPDGVTTTGSTLTDPNGNAASLTTASGVTTAKDALGRTVYKTNIPIGKPGQIPAGTYYVDTYDEAGNVEAYTVIFSSVSIASFTMPHPTTSEFTSPAFCTNNCSAYYSVSQPASGDKLTAVTEIDRPGGSSYKFTYDPTYGTISRITFPTGGYVRFAWGIRDKDWTPYSQYNAISAIVVTDAYVSDGSVENHWIYDMESLSNSAGPFGRVHAPDGSRTDYTGACFNFVAIQMYAFQAKASCKENSRSMYDSAGNQLKTVAQDFNAQGLTLQVATSLYDSTLGAQQQLVNYVRDAWGNVTEEDNSDYYACTKPCPAPTQSASLPAPASGWKRRTYTTYAALPGHIVNKPSHVLITDNGGTRFGLTDYAYDTHGNLTDEYKCMAISGTGPLPSTDTVPSASCPSTSYWQTHLTYDTTGQMLTKVDGFNTPRAATTTFTWSGQGTGYLYSVKHPNGASDGYTYFETTTGAVKTHSDWNTQVTTYDYSDPLNRLKSVTGPAMTDGTSGASGNGTTNYTYVDTAGAVSVQEQHKVDTSGTTTSTTKKFDGLGRVNNTTTTSPQCSTGIKVDTTYDSMGRVYTVSNPYCAATESTYGLTYTYYDALGRTSQIKLTDGVTTDYAYGANATQITDPSNGSVRVAHIQQTDGLGRLAKVCEVTSASLGSGSPASCGLNYAGTGYLTSYTYDPLGNLTNVSQSGLARSFTYDAMSRLKTATNPEAGALTYTYSTPGSPCAADAGVPCTRQDARGVITSYQFDNMNRLIGKRYSVAATNSTGPISDLSSCYQYDVSISSDSYPKGKLTAEWEQTGACPTTPVSSIPTGAVAVRLRSNHDVLGHVGLDQQCLTASSCPATAAIGSFAYTYNLLGNPVQSSNGIRPATAVSANQAASAAGNGTPITAPSVTWKTTYDYADHLVSAFVQDQPQWSGSAIVWPSNKFIGGPKLLQVTGYDPFGHIAGEQRGIPTGSTSPSVSIARQYDKRSRIQSETDQGIVTLSAATGSTGSITLSGSEKSKTSTGVAASAVLSINGSEQSTTINPCQPVTNCYQTIYDGGSQSVSVNGVQVGSISWSGQGSSGTTLASSLASSINANSSSPVTATASGSSVVITSKVAGPGGNYPISVGAAGWNSQYFSYPSFNVSAPGAMSGGVTGGTVYDSGTVTATINGINASAVWGSSSTSATLASSLASAIATADGSFLTASASGSIISLASKSTGSAVNWPIQISVIYDTADFTSSSFAASASGMSGGANANQNTVTLYSYQVPATGGYAPNGDIIQHVDSVMGTWNFTYDPVDRIVTANQSASTATSTQYSGKYGCWVYDAFGNRTSEAFSTTACTSNPPLATWATYNPGNRMATSSYAPGGVTTDAAGNTLVDGRNQYWFDAEGRLCAAKDPTAGTSVQYAYDADGARIAQLTLASPPSSAYATCAVPALGSTSVTKRYLVDQSGGQVTELNGSGTWQHSNIWAGGKLIATYDTKGIHFAFSDPLGTRRVQANAGGQNDETCTGLPFGNDLNNPKVVNCVQTANSLGTNDDATEHHFTAKERDTESGNDYFGARYYSSSMGRFMSPDWSVKIEPVPYAKLGNPQSLNLYAYVLDNPLTHFDLDGHACDSLWHCAQGFLNAVEVKVTLSIGTQGSVQWGVAKAEYHATVLGVEGTSGLGGGNKDATVTTGAGASASASGGQAKGSVSVNADAKLSTTDGANASLGASAKVALGPASASASASIDKDGPHTSAGPGASADKDTDWKVGGSLTAGVGVGGAVNFSQLGRAFGDLGDSLSGLGGYLKDKFMPTGAPSPSGGVPGIPDPQHPF